MSLPIYTNNDRRFQNLDGIVREALNEHAGVINQSTDKTSIIIFKTIDDVINATTDEGDSGFARGLSQGAYIFDGDEKSTETSKLPASVTVGIVYCCERLDWSSVKKRLISPNNGANCSPPHIFIPCSSMISPLDYKCDCGSSFDLGAVFEDERLRS